MADYTPSVDVFGRFIEGLKMGRDTRLEQERRETDKLTRLYKQREDELARRKQDMDIMARTGGSIRTGQELDTALRALPARGMEEVLSQPAPETGPARPMASEEEQVTPMRFAAGLESLAKPSFSFETEALPGGGTMILPKTYTGMPKVVSPQQQQQPRGGMGGGGDILTKGGVDFAAKVYLQTGKMPPMGMGNANSRSAIVNRAAEMSKNPEGVVDVTGMITNTMQTKANETSYAQLQKQADNIGAFERTAKKNLSVAMGAATKLGRSGVPIFNEWVNAGRRSVTGNPDLSAFDLATRTFVNEYARITTSVTGGGVTSDTARKEVEDLLMTSQTPEQFQSAADTALLDLQNRLDAYSEQFAEIKGRSEARTKVPLKSSRKPAQGEMSKDDFAAWKAKQKR